MQHISHKKPDALWRKAPELSKKSIGFGTEVEKINIIEMGGGKEYNENKE